MTGRRRRRIWVAGVVAFACAAGRPPPPRPAAAPAVAPAGEPRAPTPRAALAGSYGPEPEDDPSPLERRTVAAIVHRAGRGAPRESAALTLAARQLARGAADGEHEPLSRERVRAALATALAFDPAPAAHLVQAEVEAAPGAVADSVARAPPGATHVGVGAAVRSGRATLVALLARRTASLEAFPRAVQPGTTSVLRGALAGLERPSVFVTPPSGAARHVPGRTDGPSFSAPIRFDAPGRWLIEVTGEGPRGPEVAALLVVSSGGASIEEARRGPDGPDPADLHASEARVVGAIEETRRRAGLDPLDPWPELANVARRHSEAMLAAGLLAHRLPGSADAGERLRHARVPYARVLENVARAPSALAAHRLLEESPAHRHNILARDVTRVGCGIARGTLPGGEPVVYLTELMVEPVQDGAGDRLTPDARVREALWQERTRLGAPPLQSDPALDALAREAARTMLRERRPSAQRLAEAALREHRKKAAADAFVAGRASDAARSKNLADRSFRRVGVGVVVGDDPQRGSGLLWIAIVYTD